MAKARTPAPETGSADPAGARKRESPIVFVASIIVLTGLSVGAGGLLGLQLAGPIGEARPEKPEVQRPAATQGTKDRPAVNLKSLPAIVTNLAGPERIWIRMEVALVMDSTAAEDNSLAGQIGEDILAFLRTLSLAQIQGASGFQHLREDLSDRVRTRSRGKVRDLVIQALIVE
jgi:flagellar FliL protein